MVRMMKKYYKDQAKNMYEIRSIRHDMQAHMIVLQHYLDRENYQQAREYLQEMRISENFKNEPMTDTGNDLVNAIACDILNSRKTRIKLVCEGYIPENIKIMDFDLCTLFSNLISNAAEACDRLIFHEKKIILKLEQKGNDFSISISNPIEWDLDETILGVTTTKKDKLSHGYGVRNIKRAVEAYAGKIDFYVAKSLFRVEIMFYNVIKAK